MLTNVIENGAPQQMPVVSTRAREVQITHEANSLSKGVNWINKIDFGHVILHFGEWKRKRKNLLAIL